MQTVLFPYNLRKTDNEYVARIVELVKRSGNYEITCSKDEFWAASKKYDYIFINWPDYFYAWRTDITDEEVEKFKEIFFQFKGLGTKIFTVFHDEYSHFGRNKNINAIFDICYGEADVVLHLGEFSQKKYEKVYQKPEHNLLFHPLYKDFNFNLEKSRSRAELAISDKKFYIIAPGSVRKKTEFDYVVKIFENLRIPSKQLVFVRQSMLPDPGFVKTVNGLKSYIYYHLQRLRYKRKGITWYHGFMDAADLSRHFLASDLIILPRLDILNSGNVTLGSQFNKPVIGPAIGNIKEILQQLGHIEVDLQSDFSSLDKVTKQTLANCPDYALKINEMAGDEVLIRQLKNILN